MNWLFPFFFTIHLVRFGVVYLFFEQLKHIKSSQFTIEFASLWSGSMFSRKQNSCWWRWSGRPTTSFSCQHCRLLRCVFRRVDQLSGVTYKLQPNCLYHFVRRVVFPRLATILHAHQTRSKYFSLEVLTAFHRRFVDFSETAAPLTSNTCYTSNIFDAGYS